VQLQGIWPAPAAVAASPDISSSLHLAVSVQLHGSSNLANSSSSKGVDHNRAAAATLGAGWQVIVSFMPESAHNASCHSTASASSSSGLQLAVLLQLPASCACLQEGGWLHVYAVKMPPACPTKQSRQQHGQATTTAAAAGVVSQPLPAVTLLVQQYISAVQLAHLLDANPAAAAVSQMLQAAKAQPGLLAPAATASDAGSSRSRSSSGGYSCVLHLQAARGVQQQQQGVAPAAPAAKRSKHDAAEQQVPANVHARDSSAINQQQLLQAVQPLGAELGSWLAAVAGLQQQQQQQQDAGLVSSFGLGSSAAAGLLLPFTTSRGPQAAVALPGKAPVALLNGNISLKLGAKCQAQISWAARPQLPQQQQQQQDELLPVQLALQASTVQGLAQLHRAVLLAVLEHSDGKQLNGSLYGQASRIAGSSSSKMWRLELQQPQQLRKVLHRLKQLQQQLLHLQDSGDDALEARKMLAAAVEAAAAGVSMTADAASRAAHGLAGNSAELQQQQVKWEQGLHAVYGRMLLALADAACVVCQEG
jgi:hypothetical protein